MSQCSQRFGSSTALQVCSSFLLRSQTLCYVCSLIHHCYVIGTNPQKRQLFVMAVRTATGTTLPGNLTIIPSEQKWVFHSNSIYSLAFRYLYSDAVCCRNRLLLSDEDDAEYGSFEALIDTSGIFAKSKVMLCTFHAIWLAFKKDILPKLELFPHGKVYGEF